jgi:hypothetical protein
MIFIVVVGINFIVKCNKDEKTKQSIESRITYDSDGKEMQKIKKQIYSDQELK